MANIGKLRRTKDENGELMIGVIRTLEMSLQLKFYPVTDQSSSSSPAYRIYAVAKDGGEVEIGAAWRKEMNHPDHFGKSFLSITIDDPSLPNSLNVAAFSDDDGETWVITFRRRTAKAS